MDPFARRLVVDTRIRELQAEATEQRLAAACRRSESGGSDAEERQPRWFASLLRKHPRSAGIRPTAPIVRPTAPFLSATRTLRGRSE